MSLPGQRELALNVNIVRFNGQGMIARRSERRRDVVKQCRARMRDVAHLAVHGRGSAGNARAECLADALMPQADAENWQFAGGLGDEVKTDAGAVRVTRAWRDHDPVGRQRHHLVDGYGVVAMHDDLSTDIPHEMIEVVSEAVVIID